MNERHMKIMVPYEEPTDTCQDCSEHPCDCGIPAGYQPDIRFAANFAPHIKVMEDIKVAEIIQQRDDLLRYNEAFRQEALICANCDAISKEEYDRAIEQLTAAREELNTAREDQAYMHKDLTIVTEQRDAASAEFYRYHGLWDRATKQLETVMYQRDRLAEALREVATYDPSDGQCNSGYSCKYIAEQALQSINQPTQW